MFSSLARAIVPRSLRDAVRPAAERLQWLAYIGSRVECPCCGAKWRAFLPFGRPERPNAYCARCGSLERHRLIQLFLEEQKPSMGQRATRVLHFAPEEVIGDFLRKISAFYTSADLMRSGVDTLADITKLPYADASFDAIMCVHILEHIPDDGAAMREMVRILKPGGWAVLQVPFDAQRAKTYEDWTIQDEAERRKHFGQEDHCRVYGRDYYDRLRAAGFRVELKTYPELAERHGLMQDEELVIGWRS